MSEGASIPNRELFVYTFYGYRSRGVSANTIGNLMPAQRSMSSEQVFTVALHALERLVQKQGVDITFPFDAIWDYASTDVPSELRPGPAHRLTREGYLELTGGMTKASSAARAGSPTREYRPGRQFYSTETPKQIKETPAFLSPADALKAIELAMAARGFIVTTAQLANFYLALQTSPLVILTGTSGTGKSRLPRLFAELIGVGDRFKLVSVQPQWADNADLFGYTSSLAPAQFVEGDFTRAIVNAASAPDKLTIVLLDEMNLAAVEHYFSDFLSIIETRRKQAGHVVTDPLPLDLPMPREGDLYQHLRGLSLPSNVRVVGTANMDETTRAFSPKVLDRAFSIEFGDVDLTAFVYSNSPQSVDPAQFSVLADRLVDRGNPVSVSEVYVQSQSLFDRVAGLLEEVKDILNPAGISFGYRTRDAICLYLWHWAHDNLSAVMPLSAAFDLCLLQKVLPKIGGTGEALRQSLEQLRDWLEQDEADNEDGAIGGDGVEPIAADSVTGSAPARPCPRSVEKVTAMLRQLRDEGATTYWSA